MVAGTVLYQVHTLPQVTLKVTRPRRPPPLCLPPRRVGHVRPLELVVGRHPQHDAVRVGPRGRGLVAGLLDGEEGVGREEPLVLRRLPGAITPIYY